MRKESPQESSYVRKTERKQTLLEKFTAWFVTFLQNAE